jgi:signal transduction histidine kinase
VVTLTRKLGVQLFLVVTLSGVIPTLVTVYICLQFAQVRPLTTWEMIVLGFIATGLFAAGAAQAIYLVRHINNLLAKANAATQIGVPRAGDQLKQLDSALDEMSADLRDKLRQLQSSNEQLRASNAQLEITNQNLQKLDSFKSDFIRFASHEFRTPLTTIRESVSMLAEGLAGPLNDKQAKFTDIAKRNTDRLIEVITSLILLTKLRTQIRPEDQSIVSIKGPLEDAVKKVQSHPNFAALKITEPDPSQFASVLGDRNLLTIAIQNLLNDALTHAYPDTQATVSLCTEGDSLKLTVSSRGSRIVQGKIGKAFDGLRREITPQNMPSGHGSILDLTIASEIVKWHRGKLEVDTLSNGETPVIIRLPKTTTPSPLKHGAEASSVKPQSLQPALVQ